MLQTVVVWPMTKWMIIVTVLFVLVVAAAAPDAAAAAGSSSSCCSVRLSPSLFGGPFLVMLVNGCDGCQRLTHQTELRFFVLSIIE